MNTTSNQTNVSSTNGGTAVGGTVPNPWTPLTIPTIDPKQYAAYMQAALGAQGPKPAPKREYESQMTTRVSVPITSQRWGKGRLEMTLGEPTGQGYPDKTIEMTIVLPGREVIDFAIHPKDLDSLVSQRTMDKLATK